jgi:hypothetical protein
MNDYSTILKQLYPEGSKQGECGVFCHKLMQFPLIGDTLASKTAAVNKFGYTAKAVQGGYDAGDVIVTKESLAYGHVAFINAIIGDNLQLTESNFNLDLKVHHTRLINKMSPVIVGCIRGPLLFLPAQKKTFNQQVLVLCQNIPDANMSPLKQGIGQYLDAITAKTAGAFTVTVDYASAAPTAHFGIIQFGDTIYLQPRDVANAAQGFKKQYDAVCLVYDKSKMTPKPNHPVEYQGLEFGFAIIQLPLDWISSSGAGLGPLVIYPDAAELFFAHELCHAEYSLANARGNAGQRDKTHDPVVLNPQTPSQIYYFLDYLLALTTWWPNLCH